MNYKFEPTFEMNRMAWVFMLLFLLTLVSFTVVVFVGSQECDSEAIEKWCEGIACQMCFKDRIRSGVVNPNG